MVLNQETRSGVRRHGLVQAQFVPPEQAASYARSHVADGPSQRFFEARIDLMTRLLGTTPGGELLDVGCGPGIFLRHLADSRPGDFSLTGVDLSEAMIDEARQRMVGVAGARLDVGSADALPYADSSFDVVVAMGVLEYCDVPRTLAELARVARPGATVIVSMLNPLSPYRLCEWGVYWPLVRVLGRVEAVLGRPAERRHGRGRTGIRALPAVLLRRRLRASGLRPVRTEFFDLAMVMPPLDRLAQRWAPALLAAPARGSRTSRALRWMNTGYVVMLDRPPVR